MCIYIEYLWRETQETNDCKLPVGMRSGNWLQWGEDLRFFKTYFLMHILIPFEFSYHIHGLLLKYIYILRNHLTWEEEENPWERKRKPFLPLDSRWPSGPGQEYMNKCCSQRWLSKEKDKEFPPINLRTLYGFEINSIIEPAIKEQFYFQILRK